MSNDILDEKVKYNSPRTCPNCGHEIPFVKFVSRFLRSFGLSRWACHSCGTMIKCEYIKIQTLWTFGMLVSGALLYLLSAYFDMDFLFIFLVVNVVFVFATFYHIKFELSE